MARVCRIEQGGFTGSHVRIVTPRVLARRPGLSAASQLAPRLTVALRAIPQLSAVATPAMWSGTVRMYENMDQWPAKADPGFSADVWRFIQSATQARRARTLELNLEPSEGRRLFDEARHGPATVLVPEFVDALLERIAGGPKGPEA